MSGDNNEFLEMELDYEPDLIQLEDEAGIEHTFEVIDALDVQGARYLALVLYGEKEEQSEEDEEMIIMRLGEDNGEEYLDIVEDEAELAMVGEAFMTRLSEVYNIDLDELENLKNN